MLLLVGATEAEKSSKKGCGSILVHPVVFSPFIGSVSWIFYYSWFPPVYDGKTWNNTLNIYQTNIYHNSEI